MNPAGRKLLGLPEADWNRPIADVLADAVPLGAVIEECLQSARPIVRRALQMVRPSGGASYLGVSVSPIRDETDRMRGAICLFTDLSQVMDLEEQLRLKDSLARLGELTAGIAHEFRNGLATIHGYARLLDLDRLPAGVPRIRAGHPRRDGRDGPGGDELPELRAPDGAGRRAGRHARHRGARGRGDPRRGARARGRSRYAASSATWTATKSCCGRRSATCAGTRSRRARNDRSRRRSRSKGP